MRGLTSKFGLVGGIVAFLAVLLVGAFYARADASPGKADCLYQAVEAYPKWKPGDPRVVDSAQACTEVSGTEREKIRDMMAEFVRTANKNAITK